MQFLRMLAGPCVGGEAVFPSGGIGMFRQQPIVRHQHPAVGLPGKQRVHPPMLGRGPKAESAAMRIDHQRQLLVRFLGFGDQHLHLAALRRNGDPALLHLSGGACMQQHLHRLMGHLQKQSGKRCFERFKLAVFRLHPAPFSHTSSPLPKDRAARGQAIPS
jgi:hypothetical protein